MYRKINYALTNINLKIMKENLNRSFFSVKWRLTGNYWHIREKARNMRTTGQYVVAQDGSCRSLTMEDEARFQVSQCGIRGEQSRKRAGFSPKTSIFSYQCHFTNALYSYFIRSSSTASSSNKNAPPPPSLTFYFRSLAGEGKLFFPSPRRTHCLKRSI